MTRKLLPIEPTEEMIMAGYLAGGLSTRDVKDIWDAMVAAYGKKSKSPQMKFTEFLEQCAESGEAPISQYQPVIKYAESVGLPGNYLNLAWQAFKDAQISSGKRQVDWRKTFLNWVKGNYLRLWWLDNDGKYVLTTTGKQAIMALKVEV